MAALVRWFAPLIRPMFSTAVLRDALAFGLPRVPHAAAQQVIAVGDKFILAIYATLQTVGIYSMAVSFGLTQKLFLSAFESAWAPFYYATIREPDAPKVFRTVTTYGIAVLALLTAGLSAVGRQAAEAMTHGRFLAPGRSALERRRHRHLLDGGRRLPAGRLSADVDRPEHHQADAVLSRGDDHRGGDERGAELPADPALRHRRRGLGQRRRLRGAGRRSATRSRSASTRLRMSGDASRASACAGIAAYVAASMLPSIRVRRRYALDARARCPISWLRGGTVIVVFVGLLAMTRFFHADELRRLGRHAPPQRRPSRRPTARPTAPRWPARSWPPTSGCRSDQVGSGWRFVVALRLRLYGLRYGLPAVYNPDEVAIMSRALAFAKWDFNPHNFLYPSFYFYALFAWEGLTAVLAVATRSVESFGAFQREFFLDPTRVFVAGRLLTALLGAGTVVATGVLGSRRQRMVRRCCSPPCSSPSRRCTC